MGVLLADVDHFKRVNDVYGHGAGDTVLRQVTQRLQASVRAYDMVGRYGEVQVPALLLWGREDRVTTLSVGERLSKQLPRARLVVYPQCGHFPMLEAASASTAELARFLEEKP